jgi:threonine dehydrogenase-like Zn-dependent dehydrogenase
MMQSATPREAIVVNLVAPRQIELSPMPLIAPEAGDVLCETLMTAISPGTELAAYTGAPALRAGISYPRLLGYCNVARVLSVGSAVRDLGVGDRVLSFMSHRSHFVMPASSAQVRLPQDAKTEDAVCAYLFHLGYNAMLRSDVRAGSRVLVIGLGALGLTSIAMAALAGADVIGISDHPVPAGIARDFGASQVHSRAEFERLLDDPNYALADVVVATTNAWTDWDIALKAAAQRGTIAVLGFPGRGAEPPQLNPLDSRYFYTKQLRIEAVGLSPEKPDDRGFTRFNVKANLAFIVQRIIAGDLDPAALVSGVYAGAEIERAYQDLLARSSSPITYILRWSQD